MTTTTNTVAADPIAADRELKARHRKMWGLGDYPGMVRDFLLPLGERLVDAAAIRPGDRVLDVASGTGNAAIPAAARGADVVASDLTPELFQAGRARAAERGVRLRWEEADAEALPYDDGSYDVVLSCIGAMFAPHHDAVASELVRVCRPGGTIAMLNWTPQGVVGQLFAAMKPYAPPPPPGASAPPLWGDGEHVRARFGDAVTGLSFSRDTLPVTLWGSPAADRDYFKQLYGPTIAVYRNVEGEPQRTAALDDELEAVFARNNVAGPGEPARYEIEYLVVRAERR